MKELINAWALLIEAQAERIRAELERDRLKAFAEGYEAARFDAQFDRNAAEPD